MHTSQHKGVVFNHNSDLSGDVTIRQAGFAFSVPGEALLAFIAEHVRLERITALEQMSTHQVLGIPKRG
jgi:hypothetical protein